MGFPDELLHAPWSVVIRNCTYGIFVFSRKPFAASWFGAMAGRSGRSANHVGRFPNFRLRGGGLRLAIMRHALTILLSLFAFWLLLSGIFTPFLIAAGFGCSLAVVLIARHMNRVGGDTQPIVLRWLAFSAYHPWLIKEILFSAWDVTKRILDPRLPITPTLVEFTPAQTTDIGLVIHANSITLTPGTITVEAEHGRFLVHALTREAAASLAGSEMDRRCAAMETKP